ncbi:MAG TPA: sigma-70 family RNA polymerase sigma factor [Aggregatilinea sp.]|uniref:RNA polymerase sigma factor n=1 Tax=Aggregatilinea sp. TaxID=2806333 RepID=UPI002CA94290|nr:sigma-70 family RNA polymerase sigma factor [Aggregatilinea sp.]HML24202.1 sigma-70 family RNA polymerase sigma factor [Aggregatilinea sp.]
MNDSKAIARLKRGDITALDALIDRYQVRALRTAFLITQDAALAEDVVQDAFVNVYHSIHTFQASRPFAPWFMRTVVNGALRAARRKQAQLSLENLADDDLDAAEFLVDPAPGPDRLLETAETQEAVWDALSALTPERRAVIVLRFYLDLSEGEMAEHLNIPVGTVKSRLHSAKRHLQALLASS